MITVQGRAILFKKVVYLYLLCLVGRWAVRSRVLFWEGQGSLLVPGLVSRSILRSVGNLARFGVPLFFQVIFAVEVRESNVAWGETMATIGITFGGQTY